MTTFGIDPLDPMSIEQFIEEYCLLGFNTSSVVSDSFLAADQRLLSGIYAGKFESSIFNSEFGAMIK